MPPEPHLEVEPTGETYGSPLVSVVVATHDRAALLARLLEALAAQEDAPGFEVIVVDDASRDETPAVLARLLSSLPLDLHVIRMPDNKGPAHARNLGWRASRGSIICFTDDDCTPTPRWLATLVRDSASADVTQGRTVPDPGQLDRLGPFCRTMQVDWESGFYETCNIAYRRHVLEQMDGFDESFRRPFGEDTDLALRAIEAGATTAFAEDALVYHEIFESDPVAFLLAVPRNEEVVRVLARHPQLRRNIGWGLFMRPTHRAVVVAAFASMAALVSRRSAISLPLASGGWLYYAYWCRRFRPKPKRQKEWISALPWAFTIDAYETWTMLRASIRHRKVLL